MFRFYYLPLVAVFAAVGYTFAPWKLRRRRAVLPRDVDTTNETSVHLYFMEMALEQARKAEEVGEVPIGAIVVQKDGVTGPVVLSKAHNLVEKHHDASSHAELLALRQAAKAVKNWRLINVTLYSTLEPCPMCLSAAQAFRVSEIVYGAPDLRLGAIETYIRLLDLQHPMHNIDTVVPGILQNESASMIRSFFRRRRQKQKAQLERSAVIKQRIRNMIKRA